MTQEVDALVLEGKRAAIREARGVISQYLATAEQWRYDRVMWAFAIMLGEIPEDSPEPGPDTCVRCGNPAGHYFHGPGPAEHAYTR